MLKIQIADTNIDINSHNYHKIDTRNLRLGLVHAWHYMVRLVLVFVDNKLKNIISYRIHYVGHTTTDSNNRCLLTAEEI